jgi:hypothetical protein
VKGTGASHQCPDEPHVELKRLFAHRAADTDALLPAVVDGGARDETKGRFANRPYVGTPAAHRVLLMRVE